MPVFPTLTRTAARGVLLLGLGISLLGVAACNGPKQAAAKTAAPHQRALTMLYRVNKPSTDLLPRTVVEFQPQRIDTLALHAQAARQREIIAKLNAEAQALAAARALLEAERLRERKAEAKRVADSTRLAMRNPPKRSSGKTQAEKPAKPVVSEVGQATTALDLNKYYESVMAMYDIDPNDSEKMREFKALKLKMDEALVKAGYTPQQIRQYYVLQFLGQPNVQPNASAPSYDASVGG